MTEGLERDRRKQILDASEKAFATCGFEGASMRQIVSEADVNLATVYYYFNSKEGLLKAVLERRFEPLKKKILDLLHQLEEESKGSIVPIEKIVEAMVLPPFCRKIHGEHDALGTQLIGRIVNEPNSKSQEMLACLFQDVRQRAITMLGQNLPGMSESDLSWRLEFMWGAISSILSNPRKLELTTKGMCNLQNTREVGSQMIAFFSAGFKAPSISTELLSEKQV